MQTGHASYDSNYTFVFQHSGENDDDNQNPVRKALRRAEARPKNLAKSMEDITTSLSPREHFYNLQVKFSPNEYIIFGDLCIFLTGQERRQDPTVEMRRSSDGKNLPDLCHYIYLIKHDGTLVWILYLLASSIPTSSSSLFSDPDHLKKMSKSVPSFLQKEVKPSLHLLVPLFNACSAFQCTELSVTTVCVAG